MKTIAIVGAGPAGSYAAELLAKKGFDVHVFEEHSRIGVPWQCTGIVTDSINNIIKTEKLDKKSIVNEIGKIRIYSPDEKFIDFDMRKNNIILDRVKFDQSLAENAKRCGALFHLNCRFMGFQKRGDKLLLEIKYKGKKNERKIEDVRIFQCDYLVGADGPASSVAKSAGLFGKRKFYQGIQARIYLKNENIVETFPGIGAFSWIVPENKNIARVGVITGKNSRQDFDAVLEKIRKLKNLKKVTVIDRQAGIVPVYSRKIKIEKRMDENRILLIGDAAAQVKATTFGGIVHGLMAAECLAEAVDKNKSYTRLCRGISRDLWLSLKIRKALNKMNEKDYNKLIGMMSKEKTKKVLEQHDRDFPSKFMLKLMFAEPRLIGFVGKLL